MALDLSNITPDELAQLKVLLGVATDTSGRSQFRPRQLHDLRLLPTKDDPRPMFIQSAESPRDAGDLSRTAPFPALLWNKATGEEVTVYSASDRSNYGHEWTSTPPENRVVTPLDAIGDVLAGLTQADREHVLKLQAASRTEKLTADLASLTPDELASVIARFEQKNEKGRRTA